MWNIFWYEHENEERRKGNGKMEGKRPGNIGTTTADNHSAQHKDPWHYFSRKEIVAVWR